MQNKITRVTQKFMQVSAQPSGPRGGALTMIPPRHPSPPCRPICDPCSTHYDHTTACLRGTVAGCFCIFANSFVRFVLLYFFHRFSYSFPMVFLWCSYGCPWAFLWFSYGGALDFCAGVLSYVQGSCLMSICTHTGSASLRQCGTRFVRYHLF